MKYRVLVTGVIWFLVSGMICGCGKKEVDYEIENTDTKEEGANNIAQYKDAEKWKDEWTVPSKEGGDQKLSINAEIVVPDIETMCVVDVEQTAVDEEFRKQFLESFFGDGEIYYHDIGHYPKEEVQRVITQLEEEQTRIENILECSKENGRDTAEVTNELEQKIQDIKNLLQKEKNLLPEAPDTYVKAENIGKDTQYAGKRGDTLYQVDFKGNRLESWNYEINKEKQTSPEELCKISARPLDVEYYGPESLRDYESVSKIEGNKDNGKEAQNECQLSKEDARNLVEKFLKTIGRSNQVCMEEKNIVWHGENRDDSDNVTDENYAIYGYSFTYGTGVDNIAFCEFQDALEFVLHPRTVYLEEEVSELKYANDNIKITVTDDGITEVSLESPVDILNVVKQVELLPLDTIKNIMKKDVTEHGDAYDFRWDNSMNRMELMYFKKEDSSREGFFSYIPVWCLCQYSEGANSVHPIIVNAIDGSVIYL